MSYSISLAGPWSIFFLLTSLFHVIIIACLFAYDCLILLSVDHSSVCWNLCLSSLLVSSFVLLLRCPTSHDESNSISDSGGATDGALIDPNCGPRGIVSSPSWQRGTSRQTTRVSPTPLLFFFTVLCFFFLYCSVPDEPHMTAWGGRGRGIMETTHVICHSTLHPSELHEAVCREGGPGTM